MRENPKAALDALTTPAPLTLGKMALLCRLDAPILAGDVSDMCETLAAIHVIERPLRESAARFATLREDAVVLYDALTPDEYRAKVAAALDAVAAFLEMLPRPAPDAKKTRQRMVRRTRRVALPHLRVASRLRARRAAGRPGRAPLAVLVARSGRIADGNAA